VLKSSAYKEHLQILRGRIRRIFDIYKVIND